MGVYYWNNWYSGWGWFLWYALLILMFSSAGSWGYTYHAHRKYRLRSSNEALNILQRRLNKGEINRDEFKRMTTEVSAV